MKKKFIAAVLAVTFATQAVSPQPAHAVVGLATGLVPVVVVGGAITATGGILVGAGFIEGSWGGAFLAIAGLFVAGIGVIILDEKDQLQVPVYRHLTQKTADELGISSSELAAYHEELEEVNAEAQMISVKIAGIAHPAVEDARKLWEDARQVLSPEAMSAVGKVSLGFHRAMMKRLGS